MSRHEPRDSSLESRFTIPQSWKGQDSVGWCPSSSSFIHSAHSLGEPQTGWQPGACFSPVSSWSPETGRSLSCYPITATSRSLAEQDPCLALPSSWCERLDQSASPSHQRGRYTADRQPDVRPAPSCLACDAQSILLVTGWLFLPWSQPISPSS